MTVQDDAAVERCARILLQVTGRWRPADGTDATLADARQALAATILSVEGRGFPPPAPDAIVSRPDLGETWTACVAAARAALANPAALAKAAANVVFWTANPKDPSRIGDEAGLGLRWPFLQGSRIADARGALLDETGATKRLFFFDPIDPAALELDRDAGPGLWPRLNVSATADAASGGSSPDKPRRFVATLLFAAWALIGAYTAVWAWFAAEYAQNAGPDRPRLKTLFWTPLLSDGKHFSLLLPFAIVMGSMLLLALAAGMAVRGLWFGAFIDDRRRLSLSRVQQWAWSLILLGGLAWIGWFNATLGGAADLFPSMDKSLWAALGINLALTPFLSKAILAWKDPGLQVDADPKPRIVTPAELDRNDSARQASWVDLVTGETAGTEGTVDVSRLQHLVISGILLTTYLIELGKMLSVVDLPPQVFAKMPDVGNTFLGLLAFSHAGYLIFKARAPEGTDPPAGPNNVPKQAGSGT